MTGELHEFGCFLREEADAGLDELADRIARLGPHYNATPPADLRNAIRQSLLTVAHSLEHNDTTALVAYCQSLSQRRAISNFTLHEALGSMDCFREHLLERLDQFLQGRTPWPPATMRQLEDRLRLFGNQFISGFDSALEQARAEVRLQSEQLAAQQRTIRELSTPILPVHDGVIVVPLVGMIDSQRATQVMEQLLQAINLHQADMVIVDITGVPVVDTGVVNHLVQTARAVRLVGAQVILVGISPEIAQTVVQLGIDLRDIPTLANLQESIAYAFRRIEPD
jgi:rsbT co-antagonist protein RsbR